MDNPEVKVNEISGTDVIESDLHCTASEIPDKVQNESKSEIDAIKTETNDCDDDLEDIDISGIEISTCGLAFAMDKLNKTEALKTEVSMRNKLSMVTDISEVEVSSTTAEQTIMDENKGDGSETISNTCNDDDLEDMTSQMEIPMEDDDLDGTVDTKEVYTNIMSVCSTTAQAIKKTITEVLSSRENVTVNSGNTSNELEANLSKRIADFENVVSGCFPSVESTVSHADVAVSNRQPKENVLHTKSVEKTSEGSENTVSHVSQVENSGISSIVTLVANQNIDANIPEAAEKCMGTSPEISKTSTCENAEREQNSTSVAANNLPSQMQVGKTLKEACKAPICVDEEKSIKKQQKTHSSKKKGEKTMDQVMKSLASCISNEDKLQSLCRKHVETLEELRLIDPRLKQLERQVMTQQREKEQLQAELNRMILAKSRLEGLCRELQRQNRAVKEESLLRIREEEEKRKEVASKFQVTLNDISALMQENSKKNIQLREENTELAQKLKALVDHYEMWEKHMEKVVQQKDLEAELAKAKHAKINLLLKQETEKFLREKQSLLENMSELQKRCTLLTSNELQLRTELGDYTSKYEDFQSVLNKSTQVFASFKTDMEATSKKIKKLEKETNVYKQKWESSNNALLGMITDKQKRDKELSNAQQRILTLEKLCRALQRERNELQNQINIAPSVSGNSGENDMPSLQVEAQVI